MICIEQLKNSDQLVFNEVFMEYHGMVYNYILKRTSSKYYAEEVTQLIFIKLWKYRKKLSSEVSLDFQLLRITKTTLIDYLRKAEFTQRKHAFPQEEFSMPAENEIINKLELKETHNKLERLVNSLPPVRKQVFELSRFNNLTHREISEKLSIAPKTVENHINLALKFLRTFFI